MSLILGISAYYHDSAAAILKNGHILAAVQEERFTRVKHDPGFPANAVQYCLSQAECRLEDIDAVVFYDKPLLKFERLLETFLATAPRGFGGFLRAMPVWLKEKLYLKQLLRKELLALSPGLQKSQLPALRFTEHHQSHAASAFYPSPFGHAAVVCLDGVGEWATTSLWEGKGCQLNALSEIQFPHSLGLLYSAFTFYCGFKVNSGEYKLMGLAPYGRAVYVDKIYQHLIDVKDDGSFALDMRYFDYETGTVMTSSAFHTLFGGEPWPQDKMPDQRCMDLAASVQQVIEEVVEKIALYARKITIAPALCLAGGVALNCVVNGRLRKAGIFDDIWIQPAAGDAGGALGAALAYWYLENDGAVKPPHDQMCGSMLGPEYSQHDIETAIKHWSVDAQQPDRKALYHTVSQALSQGQVVGWFQGRAEYGPRALGNRSILGDPRNPTLQRTMNLKIKQRESFRPFAPAVLSEHFSSYFDGTSGNPYMLEVNAVKPEHLMTLSDEVSGLDKVNSIRSGIPAVTHVDNTARVQCVQGAIHPEFHALITAFYEQTGMPMLINTSFNVRGEPPVCSPDDAIRCFLATEMDMLVLGPYLICREGVDPDMVKKARQTSFEKD